MEPMQWQSLLQMGHPSLFVENISPFLWPSSSFSGLCRHLSSKKTFLLNVTRPEWKKGGKIRPIKEGVSYVFVLFGAKVFFYTKIFLSFFLVFFSFERERERERERKSLLFILSFC